MSARETDVVSAQARPSSRRRAGTVLRSLADARGAIMVEYTVLIGAVALIGSAALIVVGAAVVHNFDFARGLLLSPLP